jgi:hypothetical protein
MYLPESMVRKFKNVQQGTDASSSGGAAGDSSWLGELRQASVGFVKFDILDINKSVCSDFAAKVQHVSAIVMAAFREVHIAGGHVNKVSHSLTAQRSVLVLLVLVRLLLVCSGSSM